jgi:hypothetical protein
MINLIYHLPLSQPSISPQGYLSGTQTPQRHGNVTERFTAIFGATHNLWGSGMFNDEIGHILSSALVAKQLHMLNVF